MELRGNTLFANIAAAARAVRGKRSVELLVDARRFLAARFASISCAALAPGLRGLALRCAAGERSGLPEPRASRGVELPFQAIVLLTKTIALTFEALAFALRLFQLRAQTVDFASLLINDLRRSRVGNLVVAITHNTFMPEPVEKYKYGILDRNPLTRYPGTCLDE